jgi:hypothetical protein
VLTQGVPLIDKVPPAPPFFSKTHRVYLLYFGTIGTYGIAKLEELEECPQRGYPIEKSYRVTPFGGNQVEKKRGQEVRVLCIYLGSCDRTATTDPEGTYGRCQLRYSR